MRNKNGVFITAILVFFGGLTVFLIMDNERPVIDPNPQTIEGTYVCLPHRGVLPGEPTTGECAFGLKAEDGGDYYAVRLNEPSQGIFDLYPGDQISVHGFLSEIRPGDELYRYESDVLISADQKIKRILHLSGDRLYSSPRAAVEIIVDTPQAGATVDVPITVSGRVREHWLSRGQWGPPGTMRLILEGENDVRIAEESTVARVGDRDVDGFTAFTGRIIYGEHTTDKSGYVIIYQSNFSGRREFIKVPVNFE